MNISVLNFSYNLKAIEGFGCTDSDDVTDWIPWFWKTWPDKYICAIWNSRTTHAS